MKKRGRPRLPDEEKRTRRLNIRVTQEEHDALVRAAGKTRFRLSIWARRVLLKEAEKG